MGSILFKIARICNSQFKWNYLKNEKHCLNFLLHFWNVPQSLNILKEKMIVIANVFPINILSKERHFGTGFGSQHLKESQMVTIFP